MTTVADLTGWLERFAPSRLAESWDNVGLLWGDPAVEVHRVMTCLTVTPESSAEAIQERASLIVSHHPVLFRATKRILRGPRRDRPSLEARRRGDLDRQPSHGVRQYSGRDQRYPVSKARLARSRILASGRSRGERSKESRSAGYGQDRRVHAGNGPRSRDVRGIRGGSRPDRGLPGMFIRDLGPGDFLRYRGFIAHSWSARPSRVGR